MTTRQRITSYRKAFRAIGFRVTGIQKFYDTTNLWIQAKSPARGTVVIHDMYSDDNEAWYWDANVLDRYGGESTIGGEYDGQRVSPQHVADMIDARLL